MSKYSPCQIKCNDDGTLDIKLKNCSRSELYILLQSINLNYICGGSQLLLDKIVYADIKGKKNNIKMIEEMIENFLLNAHSEFDNDKENKS